jgi:hypothetical protein
VGGWAHADSVGARIGALVRFAYALTGDLDHAESRLRRPRIRGGGGQPDAAVSSASRRARKSRSAPLPAPAIASR